MSKLVLRSGLVFGSQDAVVADVRIGDERVLEIGTDLEPSPEGREIDCSGCWVGPGFVDLHSHLREPGEEQKEDIASGSAAASAGGYTAVVAMPNTMPPVDSALLARFVSERGREVGLVDVRPSGTLTAGRAGAAASRLDEMWAEGVKLFTDDGDTVADEVLLENLMRYIAGLGGVVSQHAIDPDMARGGHMHESAVSARWGIQGIPGAAETAIVARDLELVRRTRVRYHVQHVSSAGSVTLIAAAKAEGLPVTAEVTPHHLAFDHSSLDPPDTNFKMMPPLGSREDREALRAAVRSGVIDAVATDHAPHTDEQKALPFEDAPFGVIGLADAAAVVNTVAGLDPGSFFTRMAVAPARIAGAEGHGVWVRRGAPANIVVFDPTTQTTPTETHSRSANSPYLGRSWKGEVRHTVLRGLVTFEHTGAAAR